MPTGGDDDNKPTTRGLGESCGNPSALLPFHHGVRAIVVDSRGVGIALGHVARASTHLPPLIELAAHEDGQRRREDLVAINDEMSKVFRPFNYLLTY